MYITYKCIYIYIHINIYVIQYWYWEYHRTQSCKPSTTPPCSTPLSVKPRDPPKATASCSGTKRKARGSWESHASAPPHIASASIGFKASTITAAKEAKVAIQRQCLVESRQERQERPESDCSSSAKNTESRLTVADSAWEVERWTLDHCSCLVIKGIGRRKS